MQDQEKSKAELVAELTELREQVQLLEQSEEQFRQVVLSISDHIYVSEVTADGDFINHYISPHAEEMTGYPLKKFTEDWSFWPSVVIHPDDRARAAAQAARLAQGENSELEYRIVRSDGRVVWVRDSGKVRVDESRQTKMIYGLVSDITERKQLEEQLAAIYQLGQEITLLRNEKKIFEQVLEITAGILQDNTVYYGLIDSESETLQYHDKLTDRMLETIGLDVSLDDRSNMDVVAARDGQTIYIADAHADTRYKTGLPDVSGRSQLSVPIKVGMRIIGILHVGRAKPNAFSANDRRLLKTLTDQAAVAVENARLYKEIGQRVEELISMSMISQAITSTLDLPETLTIVTDHAIRLFDAMSAAVALRHKSGDRMWFAATSGAASEYIRDKNLDLEQGIVGWVIRHGEPALVPDVSQDPRFYEGFDIRSNFKTRSVLCYPLQTRSENIGAIEVVNKRNGNFNQADLRLLSWLAMPAVNAIENARLYEAQRVAREQAEMLRKRLQSLSHRLVEVQETERRYVARELHDEAGQALASLMVGLRLLEKDLQESEAIPERMADLKRTVEEILENLHRLAMDLHPAALDHLGLIPALRQYVEKLQSQHPLDVQFETIGLDHQRLLPTVEVNLYRIVQEALANIVRHAKATYAAIILERRGNHILLIAEDDGVGFDAEERLLSKGRLGLLGIRERAEMMGGKLEIESIIGTGTTIYVEIPYANSNSNC